MGQVPQLSTHPTFVTQLWYGRPVAVLFLFIPRLGVGFRIRTEERLRVTGFQDRRHQPLDQPDIRLSDNRFEHGPLTVKKHFLITPL